jgi:hypothetical protein
MLWGHKDALWPSCCGSRFRLTALGGQQVSVDFGYLRGRALKTCLLAPWNPLGLDSRTTFDTDGVAVWIAIAAAHHFWRSRQSRS